MEQERYKVIPRTLIFIFYKKEILLIKHNLKNKIGFGKWNGIGGHIEKGENPIQAATREVREETGLEIPKLNLKFITIVPETDDYGVCLFIFTGVSKTKQTLESHEGQLKWLNINELNRYPIMEDLEIFLKLIRNQNRRNSPKILAYKKEKDGIDIQVVH